MRAGHSLLKEEKSWPRITPIFTNLHQI